MEWTLKRDGWQAVVRDMGAELISLTGPQGKEYMWSGDPTYWSGRNPVLFPMVGRIPEGKTVFEGVPHELSKHGFARGSVFTLVERGEDFITLELRESEATLAQYPYPFRLTITHRLTDAGFSTEYRVDNSGEKAMPFCIGGHPAFLCPQYEGERFEDYELVFDEEETCETLRFPKSGHLDLNLRRPFLDHSRSYALNREIFREEDTIMPIGLRSTGVTLRHRETGHGVYMTAPDFPMLAFWSPDNGPFLCLEPWQGCPPVDGEGEEFSAKRFCVTLRPGESKTLVYTIQIV